VKLITPSYSPVHCKLCFTRRSNRT